MVFDAFNKTLSKITSLGKDMKKSVQSSVMAPMQKMQTSITRNLPLLPKSTLFDDMIDTIKKEEFLAGIHTSYAAFQKTLKKQELPAEDASSWKSLGKDLETALSYMKTYAECISLVNTFLDDVESLLSKNKLPQLYRESKVVPHATRGLVPKEKQLYLEQLKLYTTTVEKLQDSVQKQIMPSAYTEVSMKYDLNQEVKTLKETVVQGMDGLINQLIKRVDDTRAIERSLYSLKSITGMLQIAKNKGDKAEQKKLQEQGLVLLQKDIPAYHDKIKAAKAEEEKVHASSATSYEAFLSHFTVWRDALSQRYQTRLSKTHEDIKACDMAAIPLRKKYQSVADRVDKNMSGLEGVLKKKDPAAYKKLHTLFEEHMSLYDELSAVENEQLRSFYKTWYGYEAASAYAHTLTAQRNAYLTEWLIQLKGIQMYTKLFVRFKQRYQNAIKDILNVLLDVHAGERKEAKALEQRYKKELDEVVTAIQRTEKSILKNDERIEMMKKEFPEIEGNAYVITYQHDFLQQSYLLELTGMHAGYLNYAKKIVTDSQGLYTSALAFMEDILKSKRVRADDKRASFAIHKTKEMQTELDQMDKEIQEYDKFLDRLHQQKERDEDIKADIVVILKEYEDKQKKYTKEKSSLEEYMKKQQEKATKYEQFKLPYLIQGKVILPKSK